MKCKHCAVKMDNPILFYEHERNCLNHQKQNGLIKDEKLEKTEQEIDYSSMTVEQLKGICKEHNLDGYTSFNKDDLIKFIKENIK